MTALDANGRKAAARTVARGRTLWTACAAHALHDGYTDLIYLLLPVWQAEFGLGYGALAFLRGLAAATMAGLQVPAGRAAERLGGRTTLALGTVLAAIGYLLAGYSAGLAGLCVALVVTGCGLSTQHPIASAAVSRAYQDDARGPLGTYNFAGDVGKAAIPGGASLLLVMMSWHQMVWFLAALGAVVAVAVAVFFPANLRPVSLGKKAEGRASGAHGGFPLLLAIGILDSSVRMGFLTFLPFLLKEQGASLSTIGSALALVFIGGAAGKFACGWLGARFGVLATVLVTEAGTAAAILSVLVLPLVPVLALLPVVGLMLNGTSSVLYGTVPELAPSGRTDRAFAIFYTGTIGAGAIAPILFGILGDAVGSHGAMMATAITAAAILPLAIALSPRLAAKASAHAPVTPAD
ncbi:MFS transporter [Bradyrhizobium erythrophlei]|uniref:Cyanate permease n=1 Tax=Bradyrhizobium erythrophlei TaxID=1437360 RepID=A0A1M5JHY4_9BRAD|nr:MFS transporter [Bradyrhizobium erythrophlei]SHG40015.1 Cyanate permease [Bradyrhizobium erythrophlei]